MRPWSHSCSNLTSHSGCMTLGKLLNISGQVVEPASHCFRIRQDLRHTWVFTASPQSSVNPDACPKVIYPSFSFPQPSLIGTPGWANLDSTSRPLPGHPLCWECPSHCPFSFLASQKVTLISSWGSHTLLHPAA